MDVTKRYRHIESQPGAANELGNVPSQAFFKIRFGDTHFVGVDFHDTLEEPISSSNYIADHFFHRDPGALPGGTDLYRKQLNAQLTLIPEPKFGRLAAIGRIECKYIFTRFEERGIDRNDDRCTSSDVM
jgi:hypothetical protein